MGLLAREKRRRAKNPEFRFFEVPSLSPIYQAKYKLYKVVDSEDVDKAKRELRAKGYRHIRSLPSTLDDRDDRLHRAIYYFPRKQRR